MSEDDLFGKFVDLGARSMLASMRGDTKEAERLVKEAREVKAEIDGRMIANLIDEAEIEIDERRKERRENKPRKSPKLTSSLGDVLKAAGVVAGGKKGL